MKKGLYLRVTKKKDGSYNISGTPQSLDALGSMLVMKAKNPTNFFGTLTGHGSEVSITIPGIECPEWMKS